MAVVRTRSKRTARIATLSACSKGKVLGVLVILAVGAVVIWSQNNSKSISSSLMTASSSSSSASSATPSTRKKAKIGQLERKEIKGVDVLVQYPESSSSDVKGILFVGHGCSHAGTDFWPSTPTICPECLGLPEEMAIVKMAIEEFQFAVVAMSSGDREKNKCWKHGDGPRVAPVLKEIADSFSTTTTDNENGNKQLPILAFGASSGGNFVGSILLEDMEDIERPLEGFIAQISAPEPRTHPASRQHPVPIAVYITMNRDERTDREAERIVQSLISEKHPAKHIRLPPLIISETFFHERIPDITEEQSRAMFQALNEAGHINKETGQLAFDPRQYSHWRDIIKPHAPITDTLVADRSSISEVMNVARATHEMSRDRVREGIEFILSEHAKRGPLVIAP